MTLLRLRIGSSLVVVVGVLYSVDVTHFVINLLSLSRLHWIDLEYTNLLSVWHVTKAIKPMSQFIVRNFYDANRVSSVCFGYYISHKYGKKLARMFKSGESLNPIKRNLFGA